MDSRVRCGTWLYRVLNFAFPYTFIQMKNGNLNSFWGAKVDLQDEKRTKISPLNNITLTNIYQAN